ncbi:MAG: GHMP kinase [Alphaproteobacteria bacterium]|nr:GHMP kinase [Alphaproteobacteria bacterium]
MSRADDDIFMTRTPLRISFNGGGTDLPSFFELEDGLVVSSTINKYIYVTVKRLSPVYKEQYRLNYSTTESVASIDEISNDIARECLRLVEVEGPLYIGTFADLPANSGLGSSSSFAVGLLNALHLMRGEQVSNGQLAEEAAHVEIEMLGNPIGKQDQYAAVFGGLNGIEFRTDGSVSIEPLTMKSELLQALFDQTRLYWTGITRNSSEVLTEQNSRSTENRAALRQMREQAMSLRGQLREGLDPAAFGALLDENWQAKRKLASGISNDEIDRLYSQAIKAGAYGGKLCGAGGGGFLMFLMPPGGSEAVHQALGNLGEVTVAYEPHGSIQMLPRSN